MKCNSCCTSMVLERTESSAVSRSEWYQCPLCHKVRMTTGKTSVVSQSALAHDAAADLNLGLMLDDESVLDPLPQEPQALAEQEVYDDGSVFA